MSKLKIAICLSGLVGSNSKGGSGKTIDFKLAKKYFDKNLINEEIDVSFFLHCWENKYQKEILELYKPKKFSFEKPLRKNEKVIKEEGLKFDDMSDDEIISLLIEYPILIERPILVSSDKAIVGRPPELIKSMLK